MTYVVESMIGSCVVPQNGTNEDPEVGDGFSAYWGWFRSVYLGPAKIVASYVASAGERPHLVYVVRDDRGRIGEVVAECCRVVTQPMFGGGGQNGPGFHTVQIPQVPVDQVVVGPSPPGDDTDHHPIHQCGQRADCQICTPSEPTAGETRCARCLRSVPAGLARRAHDCSGKQPWHYVASVERELERLGVWLSENTDQEGFGAVDAAFEEIERLQEELAERDVERLYDTERSPGVGQTAHQARVEKILKALGHEIPSSPMTQSLKVRSLQAGAILRAALDALAKGLGVLPILSLRPGLPDEVMELIEADKVRFDSSAMRLDLDKLALGCARLSSAAVGTLSAFGIADKDVLAEVDRHRMEEIEGGKVDRTTGEFFPPRDLDPPDVAGVLKEQTEAAQLAHGAR